METCLSLGSNLGDRLGSLKTARDMIAAISNKAFLECSSVYETEPVGSSPQGSCLFYLNAIVIIKTALDVRQFFAELCRIESAIGRNRQAEKEKNSPRIIDIDIIYSGNLTVDTPELTIPHPRWAGRRFVVQPLNELRPDRRIPGSAGAVHEILLTLPSSPKVVLYREEW